MPSPRPPRLIVRFLGFGFAVIACVLGVVFALLSWQTRDRLTRVVAQNMEASQRRFADLDARRRRERLLQARALAENPTLKAAIDTYHAENVAGAPPPGLLPTVQQELDKLQALMDVPVVAVADVRGVILASSGPRRADWPAGQRLIGHVADADAPGEVVTTRATAVYAVTTIPVSIGLEPIGSFFLASPFDDAYARELSVEAHTDVAVLSDGRVVAASSMPVVRQALEHMALPASGAVTIAGDDFVVRRLSAVGSVSVYALGSVTAAAQAEMAGAMWVLVGIGVCALLLAAGGSWWLARTLSRPINQLTDRLASMASARDFAQPLPRSGVSQEFDMLADTFDRLRSAVSTAEEESESTYLGVIGVLATALDARDPYTAGHSQRVSGLSVSIAEQLGVTGADLDVLRLGAMLHDIGKIGVSDVVLRKPGKLTAEEFEQIKQHPTLGARILKPLKFLSAHVEIVELHHERPDGRGYPYGLRGDQIPLFARIVHVADAFDAMTSARAYRPGLPVGDAMAELWRGAGSDFDVHVVRALASLPLAVLTDAMGDPHVWDAPAGVRSWEPALLPFRVRQAASDSIRTA